jgi:beta-aspartyl-peptidase (threonine type)
MIKRAEDNFIKFVFLLFSLFGPMDRAPEGGLSAHRWALALHGGAGTISRSVPLDRREEYLKGLRTALDTGVSILAQGGTFFLFLIINTK